MKKEQIRRQFWLLLLIAGVAYLWWQSSTPGRYGELPDGDKSGTSIPYPSPAADAAPLIANSADTLIYEDSTSGVRVKVTRTMRDDTCTATITWQEADSVTSTCQALLAGGYEPLRINLMQEDRSFRAEARTETFHTERISQPPSVVEWPRQRGLLFEDLLLLQTPYWRGHGDVVPTSMAVFTNRSLPLGMVSVDINCETDSTVKIVSQYGDTARASFTHGSVWVQSFDTPNGHHLVLTEHRGSTR